MDFKYITEKIIKIINDTIEKKLDITLTTDLSDLGIDSVTLVQIIVKIENEFGIVIEENDLSIDVFKNVKNISEYLINKISSSRS